MTTYRIHGLPTGPASMASLMVPGIVLILLLDSLQAETEDETRGSKDADHIHCDTHVLLGTCGGWGRDMRY